MGARPSLAPLLTTHLRPFELASRLSKRLDDYDASIGTLEQSITTPLGVVINALALGCKGDGGTDDRVFAQAAVDAAAAAGGGYVFFPAGTYRITKTGTQGLTIPSTVGIFGVGSKTVLQLDATAANTPNSTVWVLRVTGDDVKISDLVIDGNNAQGFGYNTQFEHNAGIFADNTDRFRLTGVEITGCGGDGVQFYQHCEDLKIEGCHIHDNNRQGISLTSASSTAPVRYLNIVNTTLRHNALNQIDSEPSATGYSGDVTITGCTIDIGDGPTPGFHAISFGGAKRWSVVGNAIRGESSTGLSSDITFSGNYVEDSDEGGGGIFVYEKNDRVSITGNVFRSTHTQANGPVVRVEALAVAGQKSSGVTISGNVIDCSAAPASSIGIMVKHAIDVTIVGNTLIGPGLANASGNGMHIRAVDTAEDFRLVNIVGNTIRNFGKNAIAFAGNGAAKILFADVSNNVFEDTAGTMTVGIDMDTDNAHALQAFSICNNACRGGTTTPIAHQIAGASALVAATSRNTGWLNKD